MGVCLSERCLCFNEFKGEKCTIFQGKCWLFYCFRMGCQFELTSLRCACSPFLEGKTVTSGIYFYDHGIEDYYAPPPRGYLTKSMYESHILHETMTGEIEVIGRNYQRQKMTDFTNDSSRKKYNPSLKKISSSNKDVSYRKRTKMEHPYYNSRGMNKEKEERRQHLLPNDDWPLNHPTSHALRNSKLSVPPLKYFPRKQMRLRNQRTIENQDNIHEHAKIIPQLGPHRLSTNHKIRETDSKEPALWADSVEESVDKDLQVGHAV
ncbi:uncharacterized protein [Parasteatoda tepidariorum]|uniref:uncharacterized protein isoform X2 n=1 Tax=Parasteatoda tepidariorum TaxID=114398 RepID=UPI0039BD1DF2